MGVAVPLGGNRVLSCRLPRLSTGWTGTTVAHLSQTTLPLVTEVVRAHSEGNLGPRLRPRSRVNRYLTGRCPRKKMPPKRRRARRMAPARRTAPAPAPAPAPWSELPAELWAHIFEFVVEDRYRNITLPALAQLARASRLSKTLLQAARMIKTPYDAEIEFSSEGPAFGMPVRFVGGVAFGKARFCFALVFIRHPANGRTFAVSVEDRHGFHDDSGHTQVVKRYHSLAQLAQRLNGHASEWSTRLNDVHYMQYQEDEWRSSHGRALLYNADELLVGLMPPRCQWLQTQSLEMRVNTKGDYCMDFLGYAVEERTLQDPHPTVANHYVQVRQFKRKHELILFEEDANGVLNYNGKDCIAKPVLHDQCWYGKSMSWSKSTNPGPLFRRPESMEPGFSPQFASELSIALGLFADPSQAEGCRWLVSLFKHCNGKHSPNHKRFLEESEEAAPFPRWHDARTPMWKLQMMGEMAIAADNRLCASVAAPRVSRGAAAMAVRGMRRCKSIDDRYESAPEDDDSDYDANAHASPDAPRCRKRPRSHSPTPSASGSLSAVDRFAALVGTTHGA